MLISPRVIFRNATRTERFRLSRKAQRRRGTFPAFGYSPRCPPGVGKLPFRNPGIDSLEGFPGKIRDSGNQRSAHPIQERFRSVILVG